MSTDDRHRLSDEERLGLYVAEFGVMPTNDKPERTPVVKFVERILAARAQANPPPVMCHNGHPLDAGRSIDHAPGESDLRWCNVCGEVRRDDPAPVNFWDRLGISEGGLPIHLPMGVTEAGQGPTDVEDAHHWICWCPDAQCPLTRSLALITAPVGKTREQRASAALADGGTP